MRPGFTAMKKPRRKSALHEWCLRASGTRALLKVILLCTFGKSFGAYELTQAWLDFDFDCSWLYSFPADMDDAQWTTAGGGSDDDVLSFSLVRSDEETISGILLNASGKDWTIDPRPQLTMSFQPAELLKFDMPSVPAPKNSHGSSLVIPAKASLELLKVEFRKSRWVFSWANDSGDKTHQCSYTLHPKGCEISVRVEHLGLGHFLEATIKV